MNVRARGRFPVFWRLVIGGAFLGLLCSGMIFYLDTSSVQGSALLQGGYLVATTPASYPAPATTTAPQSGASATPSATATITMPYPSPGEETATPPGPTPTLPPVPKTPTRPTETLDQPNLLLTENAQMESARITPGQQTVGPTSTPTVTDTPTPPPVFTETIVPEPTHTPVPESQPQADSSAMVWPLVAAGSCIPLVVLAFGVLAVALAREASR